MRKVWYLIIACLLVVAFVLVAGTVWGEETPAISSHAAPTPQVQSAGDTLGGSLGDVFVVGQVSALVIVNEPTWTGEYTPAPNGSSIFAASIYIQAFDLRASNVTLQLSLYQAGIGYTNNESILLVPGYETDVSLSLKPDTSWTLTRVYFDLSTYWEGKCATPISLFPVTFLNMGGLDLLGLLILYEGCLAFVVITLVVRRLMQRTQWAPRFSMGVVGHVILGAVLAAVIFNYPWIDHTFAGWSPVVYVFGVAPLIFLWSLSLYNRGYRAMVLQWVFRAGGSGVALRRWLVRLAPLPNGRGLGVIEESWKDTFFRMVNVWITIDDPPLGEPEHFTADLLHMRSPTQTRGFGMRKKSPLDIPILNLQEDDITVVYWAKTGEPLTYEPSHFSLHKWVDVPATALVPAHREKKLCRPHIVAGHASWNLHNLHYRLAAVNMAEGAEVNDLVRLQEETEAELSVLKSHMAAEVERKVARRMAGLDSATAVLTDPVDEEEAEDMASKRGGT